MNDKQKAKLQLKSGAPSAGSYGLAITECLGEIDRLQAELDDRTKAGRELACSLGGCIDDSEDSWGQEEIHALFSRACRLWPWCDPRNAADTQAESRKD